MLISKNKKMTRSREEVNEKGREKGTRRKKGKEKENEKKVF